MNSTISMNRSKHDHTLGSQCSISSESSRSKDLTDGQATAIVADPYLPLAVVAGAGCGKTFTLVRRVARVVASTGCLPSSVVVLTFSRKACNELVVKLAEAGLKGVCCFTFHAFALRLVRQFGQGSERRAATSSGSQHMKIVQACLDQWYQKEQQRRNERNGNDGTPDAWSAETSSDQLSTRAAAERSAVARRLGRVIESARAKHVPSALGVAGGLSDPCAAYVYHAYTNYREQQRNATTGGIGKHQKQTGCMRNENECDFVDDRTISMSNIDGSSGDGALELDFAELVPRALEILARPTALAAAQQIYGFGFVDEFQDTSAEQFALLTALWAQPKSNASDNSNDSKVTSLSTIVGAHATDGSSHTDNNCSSRSIGLPFVANQQVHGRGSNENAPRRGSVTVVGDDDQMIYGWRDAMPNAFEHFRTAFGQPKLLQYSPSNRCGREKGGVSFMEIPTVRLDVNFRTKSSLLLDAASSVVEPIVGRTARARLRPFVATAPGLSSTTNTTTNCATARNSRIAEATTSMASEGTTTAAATNVTAPSPPQLMTSEGVDSCSPSSTSLSLPSSSSSLSSSTSHSTFSTFTASGRSFGASNLLRPKAFRGPDKTLFLAYASNEEALSRKRGRGVLNGVSAQPRFKTFKPPAPTRPFHSNSSSSTTNDSSISNGSRSIRGSLGFSRISGQPMAFHTCNAFSLAPPPPPPPSSLEINENSHPGIAVAQNSTRRQLLELVLPKGGASAPLQWCMLPNEELELDFVAAQISVLLYPPAINDANYESSDCSSSSSSRSSQDRHKQRAPVKASQVAVLSRNGVNVLPSVAKRLADLHIPATIIGDGSSSNDSESSAAVQDKFLHRKPIVDALALLQLICDEQDDVAARRCLKLTKGLGPKFEAALDEASSTMTAAGLLNLGSHKKSINRDDDLSPAAAEHQNSRTMPLMGAVRRALACFEAKEGPSSSFQGQAKLFSRKGPESTNANTHGRDRPPPALALKRGQAAGLRTLIALLDDSWSQLFDGDHEPGDEKDSEGVGNTRGTKLNHGAMTATEYAPDNAASEYAGPLSVIVASTADFLFPALASISECRDAPEHMACENIDDEESKGMHQDGATNESIEETGAARKASETSALLSTLGQAANAFATQYFSAANNTTSDISSDNKNSSSHGSIDENRGDNVTLGKAESIRIDEESNVARSLNRRSRGAWLRCLRAFLHATADRNLPVNPSIFAGQPSSGSVGSSTSDAANNGKVSLGTIHKSKGLEWDFVFVLRCSDGGSGGLPSLMPDDDLAATNVNRFPSKSTSEKHSHNGRLQPQPLVRSEEGKLEEERRLLHVALTRAREACAVSCALEDSYGRRRQPSRFLDDIPSHCVRVSTITEEEVASVTKFADVRPRAEDVLDDDDDILTDTFNGANCSNNGAIMRNGKSRGSGSTGFVTAAAQMVQATDPFLAPNAKAEPVSSSLGKKKTASANITTTTTRRLIHKRAFTRPRCPVHCICLTIDDESTSANRGGCPSNGDDTGKFDCSSYSNVSWLICGFRGCSHREKVGLVSNVTVPASRHQTLLCLNTLTMVDGTVGQLNDVENLRDNSVEKPSSSVSSRMLNKFFVPAAANSATTSNPFVAGTSGDDDNCLSCAAAQHSHDDGTAYDMCDLTLPSSPSFAALPEVSLLTKYHASPKCMHGAGPDCTACADRRAHRSAARHQFHGECLEPLGPEKRHRNIEGSLPCSCSNINSSSNSGVAGETSSTSISGALSESAGGDKSSNKCSGCREGGERPRIQRGKSPPRRSSADHRARAIAKIDAMRRSFCSGLLDASTRGAAAATVAKIASKGSTATIYGCSGDFEDREAEICTSKPGGRKRRRPVPLLAGQQRISAASFFKPSGVSHAPPQKCASRLLAQSPSVLACVSTPQLLNSTVAMTTAMYPQSTTSSESATRPLCQSNVICTNRLVTMGQKMPCTDFSALERPCDSSSINNDINFSGGCDNSKNSNCGSIDHLRNSRIRIRGTIPSPLKDFSRGQLPLQQKSQALTGGLSSPCPTKNLQADVQVIASPGAQTFSDD